MAVYLTCVLSKGMYMGVLSAISMATKNTCEFIGTMYLYENPNVNIVLYELDITRKLHTIELFINKQYSVDIKRLQNDNSDINDTENFNILGMDPHQTSDPIQASLSYIQESIITINGTLYLIDEKLHNHNKKLFNTWRNSNVDKLLSDLRISMNQLETRFSDLIKLSKYSNYKNN